MAFCSRRGHEVADALVVQGRGLPTARLRALRGSLPSTARNSFTMSSWACGSAASGSGATGDEFDKLRLITDPSSAYVQNAVMAAGRQFDKDGNFRDWCAAGDGENYKARAQVIKDFFSAIKVLPDLNANDVDAAMKVVAGTARQMGVEVK